MLPSNEPLMINCKHADYQEVFLLFVIIISLFLHGVSIPVNKLVRAFHLGYG